jgi:hypothetical protein
MRVLLNFDVASLYPNLIRIFGYSSRNQEDKNAYNDLLALRIKAKHNAVEESFLAPLKLTNKDLKGGLKLPLNAYSGGLRAQFNALYDNLQGFSICITGQLLILQLIHDLQEIPTLEMVEANTDAVEFYIDPDYVKDAEKVLQDWQDYTGLELEKDDVVKIIARDVNNYVEIVRLGDNDYDVHYKGGLFTGQHNFKWNKEKHKFEYSFQNDLKSNSLTICAEAILKNLLFDIPVEDTINNCNDIFRFQMITHLGHTYDKCVLEYKDGTQEELQRNNRVYAGKDKNGCKIYKIKGERKDSLANCPPNPIVDNKNSLTIDKINKKWYIMYTKQKISDFKGRGEIFMDEKLEKMKKDDLINMIKDMNEQKGDNDTSAMNVSTSSVNNLFKKINKFREEVRKRNFILDKVMPNQLGGGEYYSSGQILDAIQDISLSVGLDFTFEIADVVRFDLDAFKPATGAPQHVATVTCVISLTDIDTGETKTYYEIAQGSDAVDKAVTSAGSMALRNWFNKNFTPKVINGSPIVYGENNQFDIDGDVSNNKTQVKTPTFVPPEKKEQIVTKMTTEEPVKEHKNSDVEGLVKQLREKMNDNTIGQNILDKLASDGYTDLELMQIKLKLQNKLAEVSNG